MVGVDHIGFKHWLNENANLVLMILFVGSLFYHMQLGLQVVIEDYVSTEWMKIVSVWSSNLVFMFLGLAALIAIFRIIFTG